MPTMTNPNPCIGSAVLDNATDGSALFRALGGHYTSPCLLYTSPSPRDA